MERVTLEPAICTSRAMSRYIANRSGSLRRLLYKNLLMLIVCVREFRTMNYSPFLSCILSCVSFPVDSFATLVVACGLRFGARLVQYSNEHVHSLIERRLTEQSDSGRSKRIESLGAERTHSQAGQTRAFKRMLNYLEWMKGCRPK